MALPIINQGNFSSVELLSGKKIGIKPWKVKEEKDLLFATEGVVDEVEVRREIVKFMRRCVDNVSLFKSLSNTDYIDLIVKLRKLSKGSKIEYTYNCKCGFPLSDDISLDQHLKCKKFMPSVIPINDDISFSIKEVPFETFDLLTAKYPKASEYNYHYIIKSIESVVYKGEVFDTFTDAELIDFVDQLSSDEFDTLGQKIGEAGAEIYLEKTIKCGKCKHENEVVFGDLYNFLAF